jgi:flagellar basal body-associated protein FliL
VSPYFPRIGSEQKQKTKARYSLLQIILIIFVTVLAVIVILYYLTREEPRETERFAQFPNLFRQNEELRCVLANIVPLSLFDACGNIKNPVI